MVQEDELQYLQELKANHADPSAEWGGEGGSYTAGTGITIEDETISINAKAGSGIVVDTDLTDDSLVIMIDQEDIPYKSDLATVATTGDYDDLIDKPTIPTNVTSDSITLDHGQASGYGDRFAQMKTMVGSTSGTQQTGLRFMGTSNNTTSGTPLDFTMLDMRPAKFTVKTPAIEFGSSSSPVSTIDISSGATVKIGTNTVLTDADVVANPATTTATLTGLTVGSTSYAIPSGGGSSYTFTDGLTESSGTVSWDLYNNIVHNTTSVPSGIVPNDSFELKPDNGQPQNIATFGRGNLSGGYATSYGTIISGNENETSSLTTPSSGNIAYGFAKGYNNVNYGKIISKGSGSVAFGYAGGNSSTSDGKISAEGGSGATCIAFGNTDGATIRSALTQRGYSIAGGFAGGVTSKIEATGLGSIALGISGSEEGDIVSSGTGSIAIGRGVQATGFDSIALGYKTISSAAQAEAHGFRTKASSSRQFVIGKDNIEDTAGAYSFIIGNGTADNARSNAMTVAWDGTIVSKNLPAVDTTTDGTYVLKATVSSGVVTYAWVLEV